MRTRLLLLFILLFLLPATLIAGTVQLPETGQAGCWDASGNAIDCTGTFQDGEMRAGVPWPNPRFTVQGDCVTDRLTGLMWPHNGNLFGSHPWQKALDFASGLTLCGHSDWRLPNLNELESLVNVQQGNSATWLNGQGFTGVQASLYWSSSTFAYGSSGAWIVHMNGGYVSAYGKGDSSYVWPVRAGQ